MCQSGPSPKKAAFALLLFIFLACSLNGFENVFAQNTRSKRTLTIDDYFRIKHLNDLRISPTGKWVAYTVWKMNLAKNKSETRLWMVSADGAKQIPLTSHGYSASHPRWSPDGQYIAFLAAKNGKKTQVWTLYMHGGDSQQLTNIPQGVRNFSWSPDGQKLLLTIKDPKPGDTTSSKKKPKPYVITRLQFKRDVVGYLDTLHTHLYVFNIADSSLTQITSGPFNDSDGVWSPNGKEVAFVSNRTAIPDRNHNTDIWIVNASNTDKGKTLFQVTHNPGSDTQPSWSPDGKYLTYITDTQPNLIWYATNYLAVIPAAGGTPRILTKQLDRNTWSPRFNKDGESIYAILEEHGEQELAKFNPQNGHLDRVITGKKVVEAYTMNKAGQMAALISNPYMPAEVFSLKNGQDKRLTTANDALFSHLKLAQVEDDWFQSKDGTKVQGFFFKPVGFDPNMKYPALLRIHGGPVAQYDYSFNFEGQLFAANGYLCIKVNPRGSSGYGQKFSEAIWADWGDKDYQDVMAGVDYAIKKGYADPNRLGVGGWSYGGILTDHVIVNTNRFKAAITGASEVLYEANYGHDQYQYQWEKELGLPWIPKDRKIYDKISPFNYVENIHTPTLIMGGNDDWNVPIQNSEQLYEELKRLGRTTELVVYPGEHHEFDKPSFIKDRFKRYLAWYNKYVKGTPADK